MVLVRWNLWWRARAPVLRALVLIGAFCALRRGELVALRRRDIDLEAGMIRVRGSVSELSDGKWIYKAPKNEAGKRSVAIPRSITPVVIDHMRQFAEPGADGRVFVGAKGATPRRNHFDGLWPRPVPRLASKAFASMIYGTPATPWRPGRTPARVS
ncbi:hypothetical protein ACIHEJ_15640 [Streptomyces sp. NPDC052301]|uniref:hypothetical protein n=1 Tax=Streptomyces sp. NPDC052301 TaxID=3365687 RepID=UPI0037D60013